jgi:hypothetical protein
VVPLGYYRPPDRRDYRNVEVTEMAEIKLADVFVEMADTLIDEFDVIDFLHVLTERCVQLLGVSAAGLLLTDLSELAEAIVDGSEQIPPATTTSQPA